MLEQINADLACLCDKLDEEGLNYVAFMRLWHAEGMAGCSASDVLRNAVSSECAVGNEGASSLDALLKEFTNAANYAGDYGSHPTPGFAESPEGKLSIHELRGDLEKLFRDCSSVRWIRIDEGHPFYPVFWDFSFVVHCPKDAFVFIGSSSD